MIETPSAHVRLPATTTSTDYTWTTFQLLLVGFISVLLIRYAQFLWGRRRLYLHSSKIPGPLALPWIGCGLYFLGNTHDIFSVIAKLFDIYPGICRFWLGPRLFYGVSEPKYFEILLPRCLDKEYPYHQAEMVFGHGLFTAPLQTWKRHRKIIQPTFNQKILDDFVEIFSERADVLGETLKQYSGKGEIDLAHLISKCTLDLICETAMGVKVNAQTTDCSYPEWTERIMEILFIRMIQVWYHYEWIFALSPLAKETSTIVDGLHKFSGHVIRERMKTHELKMKQRKESYDTVYEEGPKRKAFLDYLIEVTGEGNNPKFTEQELKEEVDTFIIAGTDTTASSTCFALTMLGLHQDLQQKVYEEIVEVIGLERRVEPEDLPKLKYMERFIKETLRLFPVAAILGRAIKEDVDLGDLVLIKGTSVAFGIMSVHRNEKYWPNPLKFDPDRFLPEEVAKRHPCTYIPFSYGPRNCIGARYAMLTMKSLMATILRKYKIFTAYERIEDIKLKINIVLKAQDGFKVSVQLR